MFNSQGFMAGQIIDPKFDMEGFEEDLAPDKFDIFTPTELLLSGLGKKHRDKIHIRVQQRTNRKYITTIENLGKVDAELDLIKIICEMKKRFQCNGSIEKNVIKLSGDQRNNVAKFLVAESIIDVKDIVIHGI